MPRRVATVLLLAWFCAGCAASRSTDEAVRDAGQDSPDAGPVAAELGPAEESSFTQACVSYGNTTSIGVIAETSAGCLGAGFGIEPVSLFGEVGGSVEVTTGYRFMGAVLHNRSCEAVLAGERDRMGRSVGEASGRIDITELVANERFRVEADVVLGFRDRAPLPLRFEAEATGVCR